MKKIKEFLGLPTGPEQFPTNEVVKLGLSGAQAAARFGQGTSISVYRKCVSIEGWAWVLDGSKQGDVESPHTRLQDIE